MINRAEYKNALFIFNDNEDQFLDESCSTGGGNAIIRPYQCEDPPRATGISTGIYRQSSGQNSGYTDLNDGNAKKVIDQGINKIKKLISSNKYDKIIYSSDGKGGLGTGIFKVGDDVKKYIVDNLKKIV